MKGLYTGRSSHGQFDAELIEEKFLWILLCQFDFHWRAMFRLCYSASGLKEGLMILCYNLSEEVAKKSCTSTGKRLRAMVNTKSGHFEL